MFFCLDGEIGILAVRVIGGVRVSGNRVLIQRYVTGESDPFVLCYLVEIGFCVVLGVQCGKLLASFLDLKVVLQFFV